MVPTMVRLPQVGTSWTQATGKLVTELDPPLTSSPWLSHPTQHITATFWSVALKDVGGSFPFEPPLLYPPPLSTSGLKMDQRLKDTKNFSWVPVIESQFSATCSPNF